MKPHKINRKIVAVAMESPAYFTIPLQSRLQFIKFLSQQSVFNAIFDSPLCQATRKDDLKQPDLIRASDKFSLFSVSSRSGVPNLQKLP
jgi:hypothetical protein